VTWSVTVGSLPAGLSLNGSTGAITGTPSTPGTATFTVTATDSSVPNETSSAASSIAVKPAVLTLTATGPGETAVTPSTTFISPGQNIVVDFAPAGGLGPYSWSEKGALPSYFIFTKSTGELSLYLPYAVHQCAGWPFTVTVSDSLGARASVSYEVYPSYNTACY
jgi:hypothetical protein